MSRILSNDDLARIFKPIKQYKTDKLIEILTELADYVSEVEQQRADAVKKVEEFNKDCDQIVESCNQVIADVKQTIQDAKQSFDDNIKQIRNKFAYLITLNGIILLTMVLLHFLG